MRQVRLNKSPAEGGAKVRIGLPVGSSRQRPRQRSAPCGGCHDGKAFSDRAYGERTVILWCMRRMRGWVPSLNFGSALSRVMRALSRVRNSGAAAGAERRLEFRIGIQAERREQAAIFASRGRPR